MWEKQNKTKTRGVSSRVLETSLNSRCSLDHTPPQVLPAFPCFWWLLYSPEVGPISYPWFTAGPQSMGSYRQHLCPFPVKHKVPDVAVSPVCPLCFLWRLILWCQN